VDADGEYPVVSSEPITITVKNLGNRKLEVTGGAKVTLAIPCARCLEPVEYTSELEFDQELDLDDVANKFAAISSVKRIQFNSTVERPKVQVVPVSANEMVTRAGEEPFNDPKLSLQLRQSFPYD
jgi:ribosome biogenesis SPOUT family RNA methylase Rps3